MSIAWSLPEEFEPDDYRALAPEFLRMDDQELRTHYEEHGREAGLPGNRLHDRSAFAALVPAQARALEIGPFDSPMLSGPDVRYCDVLDTEALRRRAKALGRNPAQVPDIHYAMGSKLLDGIPEQFHAVLSSHAIEHQPDLVAHLQQVERRLASGGRYLVLVPDKRYCFDRHLAPSTIAEVLQAHEERRTVHTLRSVIEHRALTGDERPGVHWAAPVETQFEWPVIDPARVRKAVDEYRSSAGSYLDVHAWYFTPKSFLTIVSLLRQLGLIGLSVERLYPPRRNSVEFWAVLAKAPQTGGEAATPPAVAGQVPLARKRRASLLARTLAMLGSRH